MMSNVLPFIALILLVVLALFLRKRSNRRADAEIVELDRETDRLNRRTAQMNREIDRRERGTRVRRYARVRH